MRVSVVLCTYNGEAFLGEQLESLLAQVRMPDEIIVRDDGSVDATMQILEAFALRARARGIRVDIERNPRNLGFAANFDAALRHATGDVVFLCDQDDIWHPEKIARMVKEFDSRPSLGLLHTDARLVDASGRDLGVTLFSALEMTPAELVAEHSGKGFDVLLRRNTVTGATAAVRRDVLDSALPIPAGWVHDEWLALWCSISREVDCIEWASIDYRQHDRNQIGVRKRTFGDKLSRSGMSKREFMAMVADRLRAFRRRCGEVGEILTPQMAADVDARIAHASFRAMLPGSPWSRWSAVLGESMSGRYTRYSSGWRSIVSDMVGLR